MLNGVTEMTEFLDRVWDVRDSFVPCLIGGVGIGKTAAVNLHAEHVGAKVVTIIASQVLPSEVSGITMPDSDTKSMEIYDHYRLSSLQDGDILFFDELLEADQSVLSACLTLIESRQMMSGRKLPDIQIIAACNPTCEPCMIKESIRQRFMWVDCTFDKSQMFEYIEDKSGLAFDSLDRKALANMMCSKSSNVWNFLSPRSLTKLCCLMATAAHRYEAEAIKDTIIKMFNNVSLGQALLNAWVNAHSKPRHEQIIEAIKNSKLMCNEDKLDEITGDEDDVMSKLIDILMHDPNWNQLESYLSAKEFE